MNLFTPAAMHPEIGRLFSLAVLWLLLCAGTVRAQAPGEVSFGAGTAIPSGGSAENYGAGPEFQLGVGYAPSDNIVVSLNAQHARLTHDPSGGTLSVSGGFITVSRVFRHAAALRPRINLGVGVHSMKRPNNLRRTSVAASLGPSLDAVLSPQLSIFVDARYRFHFTDYGGAGDFQPTTNWPIVAGLRVTVR